MTDRPALALPPEMAQQIAMQQKVERAGRQLLESLACQIYVQLAAQHVLGCLQQNQTHLLPELLADDADQALKAAFPMAAQLGWHFQPGPAPESPT